MKRVKKLKRSTWHFLLSQIGNGYLLGTVKAMSDDEYNYRL